MPPCPFAKKAWMENKVKTVLGQEEKVIEEITNWSDDYDLIAVIFQEWDNLDKWEQEFNKELHKKDLYVMCFDPKDDCEDPNQTEEDWGYLSDEDYGWVFIQRLSKVNKYSELLEKGGYYVNTSKEFKNYVKQRRFYNGTRNEKSNEKEKGNDSSRKEKGHD